MKKKINELPNKVRQRLRGYKRVKAGINIPNVLRAENLYVYDPIIKKIISFLQHNYKWVITTFIAISAILASIVVVPWGIKLSQEAEEIKNQNKLSETITYYFTPTRSVTTADVTDNAKCWGSGLSVRSDAYRCAVNNLILDPCFYEVDLNYLDCPPSPSKHKIITVDEIEKNTLKKSDPIPWYLTLEDGSKCRFIAGVSTSIAGGRVDYSCDSGILLSLPIDDTNELQSIKCYVQESERLEFCDIQEAWF